MSAAKKRKIFERRARITRFSAFQNFCFYPQMPFIAFLGCDGSGKSTVIERIDAGLREQGITVRQGHWRPTPFDANRDATSAADDPHSIAPRGAIASLVKLAWLGFSWWFGWFRDLRRSAQGGHLVFDRYHADLLVDPRRYRYGGHMGIAKLASALMPQPDFVVFLDAHPDVLYTRKQEVSVESLAASRESYLALCRSNKRFHVVDASRSVTEVVSEVSALIRNLKLPKLP